jgi:hypothetical protein
VIHFSNSEAMRPYSFGGESLCHFRVLKVRAAASDGARLLIAVAAQLLAQERDASGVNLFDCLRTWLGHLPLSAFAAEGLALRRLFRKF